MSAALEQTYNMAMTAYGNGNFARAENLCRQVLQQEPGQQDTLFLLGHIKKALEADAGHYASRYMYAAMLEKTNQVQETADFLEGTNDDPGFNYLKAVIKRRQKDFSAAISLLENIPDDQPPALVIKKHFELAQCYERSQRYDEAFAAAEKAHTLIRAQNTGVTKDAFLAEMDQLENALSKMTPAGAPAQPLNIHFMVGFPRSGTTLLDQMLSAHPDIEVLSEAPIIRRLYNTTTEEAGDINERRAQYIDILSRYLEETDGHEPYNPAKIYIDKMPTNMVFAGFIHKIFPESKFILSLRHPCDCAISNFFQNYEPNSAMENMRDLRDIAGFYKRCFDLFFKAQETLGFPVLEVRYETLIESFREETKKACDFLGVTYAPEIETYRDHISKAKDINTPSYQQVSRPLYKESQGRWSHYKKHFEPVMDDFRPYLEKFRYKS